MPGDANCQIVDMPGLLYSNDSTFTQMTIQFLFKKVFDDAQSFVILVPFTKEFLTNRGINMVELLKSLVQTFDGNLRDVADSIVLILNKVDPEYDGFADDF